MTDLLPIWLIGSVMAVILQWIVRPISQRTAYDALQIGLFALAWPAVLMVALLTMVADTIHFLIKVASRPY